MVIEKPLLARLFKSILDAPEKVVDWYCTRFNKNTTWDHVSYKYKKINSDSLVPLADLLKADSIPIDFLNSNPANYLKDGDSTLRGKLNSLTYSVKLSAEPAFFGMKKPNLEINFLFKSSDKNTFNKVNKIIANYFSLVMRPADYFLAKTNIVPQILSYVLNKE